MLVMEFLIGLYMIGVALVLVWKIWHDYTTGEVELVSMRNVAVLGFILFQCTSATLSLWYQNYEPYFLNSPGFTALEFAGMSTLFLPIFFWSYRKGWIVTGLARRMPTTSYFPSDAGMLAMAAIVTLIAAGMRVFGVHTYLIGYVARDVAVGLAAVAAGLAGWVWAKRLLNPAIGVLALGILLANMLVAMYGEFGRRTLVAVGAGMLVGMYFSYLRYLPLGMVVKRLALVSVVPFLIIAAYTSARDSAVHDRSTQEHLVAMATGGSIGAGILDLLKGQGTGAASMWLIESHPQDFPYRHMFTPFFFAIYPVPRMMWEDKPVPIGQQMPTMARMQNVQRDEMNIGPGIIGTAGCEGGWYAVVVYAVLGGLFLRFFDEGIRLNPHSPFVILATMSALGQILGLARGETGAFAALTVITVGGTYFIMVMLGRLLESVTGRAHAAHAYADEYGEENDAGEYDAEAYEDGYGDGEPDSAEGDSEDGVDWTPGLARP
jgi:hypothetical protein